MKENLTPFHEFVADKLIGQLKAGTSSFQNSVKPNGVSSFIQPLNPTTGKNYRGLNALALSLKGYDDPRFMTINQANFANLTVKKGEKGTVIDFTKNNDIRAVRTPEGEKIKDGEGKTITKTVEFEKPVRAKAVVFNAEQLNNIQPLEEKIEFEPLERAEKLIEDSKAVIIHGGQEAYYDKIRDVIFLPEKETFQSPEKYYQAAIHQLAHWTGHESRENRPMEGKFGSREYAAEEFRAAFAAQLIGSELKIGHNFGQHAAYSHNWVQMLKEEPFQVVIAARDAQKIADRVLGTGPKQELKQDKFLHKDEVIQYKDEEIKVLEEKKKNSVKIENTLTGERRIISPSDGIYKNLVEARNNPDLSLHQDEEQSQTRSRGR